ncbi:MAG: hypothetical protein HC906_11250 [Bacteroidales bacterium]|nr:hypothetical protein [Bacteroidales bacterium]
MIETGKLFGEFVQVVENQSVISKKYNILFSPDSLKILVNYRRDKNAVLDTVCKDLSGFCVFDHHFNKIWGREELLNYDNQKSEILGTNLANNGKVFLFLKMKSTVIDSLNQFLPCDEFGYIIVDQNQSSGFFKIEIDEGYINNF